MIKKILVILVGILSALVLVNFSAPIEAGDVDHAEESIEEPAAAEAYDTTRLDEWCRGDEVGTLHMIGAWTDSKQGNSIVVVDTDGNTWTLENVNVEDDDFLLLWVSDNATPEVEDDYVVKVWREAH